MGIGGGAQQEQSFGCAKLTGTRHRACPVGPLLHSLGSTSLRDANLPPTIARRNAPKTSGTAHPPKPASHSVPSVEHDWPGIKLTAQSLWGIGYRSLVLRNQRTARYVLLQRITSAMMLLDRALSSRPRRAQNGRVSRGKQSEEVCSSTTPVRRHVV